MRDSGAGLGDWVFVIPGRAVPLISNLPPPAQVEYSLCRVVGDILTINGVGAYDLLP